MNSQIKTEIVGIPNCPLCDSSTSLWMETNVKFYRCKSCMLVFKDRSVLLPAQAEKFRYEQHNNDPKDSRYLAFLNKLLNPLNDKLSPKSSGLDFGCGPTKVAEQILQSYGHKVQSYDPYFFPDESLLSNQYDFISCSEVFEHFHNPAKELQLLNSCLRPSGLLAVMTSSYPAKDDFANWYYWKDPTHVSFYSKETFKFIAEKINFDLLESTETTFYLKKKTTTEVLS